MGAMHQQFVGLNPAAPQARSPAADPVFEPPQVFMLVPQQFARLAAALSDALGQLDELIDGLLACEPRDVVGHQFAQLRLRFAR